MLTTLLYIGAGVLAICFGIGFGYMGLDFGWDGYGTDFIDKIFGIAFLLMGVAALAFGVFLVGAGFGVFDRLKDDPCDHSYVLPVGKVMIVHSERDHGRVYEQEDGTKVVCP